MTNYLVRKDRRLGVWTVFRRVRFPKVPGSLLPETEYIRMASADTHEGALRLIKYREEHLEACS